MSVKNVGNIFYIPLMSMWPSPWPFKFIRREFPIIVSYAMTINKSQGQSLDTVGLYLPTPVFSNGQLCVAILRVTSKSGLKILIHDNENVSSSITTNVVHNEVNYLKWNIILCWAEDEFRSSKEELLKHTRCKENFWVKIEIQTLIEAPKQPLIEVLLNYFLYLVIY